MSIENHVRVSQRFLRSIRIDSDLSTDAGLRGFICSRSSAQILLSMAHHIIETGQGAFTWTGPYGCGKSSLALVLSALLDKNQTLRRQARRLFDREFLKPIAKAFSLTRCEGWRVVPVVSRRGKIAQIIGDSLIASKMAKKQPIEGWNEANLLKFFRQKISRIPPSCGGIILILDEMGKLLESAAHDGTDLYLLQQLAESASRSGRQFILVGILHQSFGEYANTLARKERDEWSKIQGRFIDLPFSITGEEQIDLLSRAIETDLLPSQPLEASHLVADMLSAGRTEDAVRLTDTLERCRPLHPVTASLLGPLSRRRFGQNQRSVFGFLNSAEPFGFKDFLRSADAESLYLPDQLWTYLFINLESAITASPDGHRWALTVDSVARCVNKREHDELHLRLLKTIAVLDLFREHSGIKPTLELLYACFPGTSRTNIRKKISDLLGWSIIIKRKFLKAYAIFAGSDFDIDRTLSNTLEDTKEIDFTSLNQFAELQPIPAKRHYHETGTMRWFDTRIAPITELDKEYQPIEGTIGEFLFVIPQKNESFNEAQRTCREATRLCNEHGDRVVALLPQEQNILALARDVIALGKIQIGSEELLGDRVARHEVDARLAETQNHLGLELQQAFDNALWYHDGKRLKNFQPVDMSGKASKLADERFLKAPLLHNELLNRTKPSGSAVTAQNALLRRMVLNQGEARLGIEGFPAEGGLFVSILEATGLYAQQDGNWTFQLPPAGADPGRLLALMKKTVDFLEANSKRTVSVDEIYELWRQAPFGVKDGLMPILVVAFILSQQNRLALYREGIFRIYFDDVDVEILVKNPDLIQIRWMELDENARILLLKMSQLVRDLSPENRLLELEPIDVARGLVAIYDALPNWTKRSMQLSKNARQIRDIFKRAQDPNRFLFDDLPALNKSAAISESDSLEGTVGLVSQGLEELVQAYPAMLGRLRNLMLSELDVPNESAQSLAELRGRARNIRDMSSDFQLEAFVTRLINFDGDIEGIVSLAAEKPPRDWIDLDLKKASLRLTELSEAFLKTETLTRIAGRSSKRQAMAVIVGMDGKPVPMLKEFQLKETDRETVNELIKSIRKTLKMSSTRDKALIFAALVEISASYMAEEISLKNEPDFKKTRNS